MPKAPPEIDHPAAGLMLQSKAGVLSQTLPKISLPVLVLPKFTVVFQQAVSLGLIVKLEMLARLTVIGKMVLPLDPQGFEINKLAEKLFWYVLVPSVLVTPQEPIEKVCVIAAGGG